jgi:hypothetical protein
VNGDEDQSEREDEREDKDKGEREREDGSERYVEPEGEDSGAHKVPSKGQKLEQQRNLPQPTVLELPCSIQRTCS